MRNAPRLQTDKKTKLRRVSVDEDIWDKINSFLSSFYFFLICLLLISGGVYAIAKLKVDGEFTGFLVYVLSPVFIIFGLYGLYRIWNNSTLIRIVTNFNAKQNMAILEEFLQYRQYHIISQDKNSILVVEEESMSVEDIWTKHFTFFVNDNEIFFNIQKHYPLLNTPVFLTHLFFKHDLKSFFEKKTQTH